MNTSTNTYTALMRAAALVVGLIGLIAVHVMDLPGKMEEVPYLGLMYIGVIIAAGFLIHRVIAGPNWRDFAAIAVLAGAVIVGFVINRTLGMPGAMDDIGNWSEPLGLLSLVIEAWVVTLALTALRGATSAIEPVASVHANVGASTS